MGSKLLVVAVVIRAGNVSGGTFRRRSSSVPARHARLHRQQTQSCGVHACHGRRVIVCRDSVEFAKSKTLRKFHNAVRYRIREYQIKMTERYVFLDQLLSVRPCLQTRGADLKRVPSYVRQSSRMLGLLYCHGHHKHHRNTRRRLIMQKQYGAITASNVAVPEMLALDVDFAYKDPRTGL